MNCIYNMYEVQVSSTNSNRCKEKFIYRFCECPDVFYTLFYNFLTEHKKLMSIIYFHIKVTILNTLKADDNC